MLVCGFFGEEFFKLVSEVPPKTSQQRLVQGAKFDDRLRVGQVVRYGDFDP